jgi:hypothetical protein
VDIWLASKKLKYIESPEYGIDCQDADFLKHTEGNIQTRFNLSNTSKIAFQITTHILLITGQSIS